MTDKKPRGWWNTHLDWYGLRLGAGQVLLVEPVEGRSGYWHCRCDCGQMFQSKPATLVNGHTKSCGCHRARTSRERAIARNVTGDTSRKKWANLRSLRASPLGSLFIRPSTKANSRWDHRKVEVCFDE